MAAKKLEDREVRMKVQGMAARPPRASYLAASKPFQSGVRGWLRHAAWTWRVLRGRLRCRRHGHTMARAAWVNAETREIGEYHVGCVHCDLFGTQGPDFRYKQTPKPLFNLSLTPLGPVRALAEKAGPSRA